MSKSPSPKDKKNNTHPKTPTRLLSHRPFSSQQSLSQRQCSPQRSPLQTFVHSDEANRHNSLENNVSHKGVGEKSLTRHGYFSFTYASHGMQNRLRSISLSEDTSGIYASNPSRQNHQAVSAKSAEDVDWLSLSEPERVPTLCLFCSVIMSNPESVLLHMRTEHDCDIIELMRTYNLDFYERVKFINYLRSAAHHIQAQKIEEALASGLYKDDM